MEAFASIQNYKAIYDTSVTDTRLTALLLKATRKIAAQLDSAGIDYETADEDYKALLADVCIDVVHRSIGDGSEVDVPYGAKQFGETTGSVTWNFSLANPYGDMFLTAENKRDLGISKTRGRCILANNRGTR